jgi:DNA-binding NarL/FixJ family response regulator
MKKRKEPKIRVVIADDHSLFAQALQAILGTDGRFETAGLAKNGREAVDLTLSVQPDVVLMDISMPVLDGFQATRELRKKAPGTPVLMLTGSNAQTDIDKARRAGAVAYVTKDRIASELIEAIVEAVKR